MTLFPPGHFSSLMARKQLGSARFQLQRGKQFVTGMLQFCASIVTVQISRIQRSAAPSVRSFSASFSTVLASI